MVALSERPTLDSIAKSLVGCVDSLVLGDLRDEDVGLAVEVHFEPIRVEVLESLAGLTSECSTDGFYDAATGARPTILYAADVAPERVRFTILHELGHHLLATEAAHLLDDIDALAGDRSDPGAVEETVCHRFAGLVLVPEDLLNQVIGCERLTPSHLAEIRRRTTASWEAVAVRAAARCAYKAAAVLLREPGYVAFSAASSRLGPAWWPRGSQVAPDGPLSKSLHADQKARPEVYRAGLPFAEPMYCDSQRVHSGLALAVLTDKPGDGRFELPEEVEPSWKEREEYCERCNEIKDQGWCDTCRGRFCSQCERCSCSTLPANPTCPGCGLMAPRRQGATHCFTCESDMQE